MVKHIKLKLQLDLLKLQTFILQLYKAIYITITLEMFKQMFMNKL